MSGRPSVRVRTAGRRGPDVDDSAYYALLPDFTPAGNRQSLASPVTVRGLGGDATGGVLALLSAVAGSSPAWIALNHGRPLLAAALGPLTGWAYVPMAWSSRRLRKEIREGQAVQVPHSSLRAWEEARNVFAELFVQTKNPGGAHVEDKAAEAWRRCSLLLAQWGPAEQAAAWIEQAVAILPEDDPELPAARAKAAGLRLAADEVRSQADLLVAEASETASELGRLAEVLAARDVLALDTSVPAVPALEAGPSPLAGQALLVAQTRDDLLNR